jgi:hypothetical protein
VYWIYGIPTGLKDAGLLDFSSNGLDQLLRGKPISPNDPVRGWIFFRRPAKFNGTEGTTVQYRFKAEDTVGNKYEATTEPRRIEREVQPTHDIQPNAPELKFSAAHLDISGVKIKFW